MYTCPKCHHEGEQSKGRDFCRACWSAYMRERYHTNPEARAKTRASNDRWKAANREQHLALMKRWREEHPEQLKAKKAEAYQRKRAHYDEVNRQWREANPDRWREILRQAEASLLERQPNYNREKSKRRAAIKRGNTVGAVNYEDILATHGLWCYLCNTAIEPDVLEFDHIVPLAKGGAHSGENIRPSHRVCNRRKGASLIEKV